MAIFTFALGWNHYALSYFVGGVFTFTLKSGLGGSRAFAMFFGLKNSRIDLVFDVPYHFLTLLCLYFWTDAFWALSVTLVDALQWLVSLLQKSFAALF